MAVSRTSDGAYGADSRVASVVMRHERTLFRVARQASLCDDDALDAVQRGLEIFVRRVDTVEPATEVAWLKVVIRNEALAIRRARSEAVLPEDLELDDFVPVVERSVEEQIVSSERVRRSAEALRALKPDEAAALMMKAHGLSYEEIGERQGWSYTKVNRAITEGRRRFLAAYEGIESGQECERYAPVLEALSAGSATSAQVLSIRPHLRHCGVCRATVRELHLSRLRRATLLWPALFLREPPSIEDLLELDLDVPTAGERLSSLPELDPEPIGRLTTLKHELAALLHRLQASDVATGVQLATSGGGGRLATLGAVLGLCLSGAGIGAVCVVTGVINDPLGLFEPARPAKPSIKPEPGAVRARVTPAPTSTPRPASATIVSAPVAEPEPTRRREPRRRNGGATSTPAAKDPSQGTTPTSHENAPITPAAASSTGQDTFTPEVPQAPPEPAPAPATGGGEFAP